MIFLIIISLFVILIDISGFSLNNKLDDLLYVIDEENENAEDIIEQEGEEEQEKEEMIEETFQLFSNENKDISEEELISVIDKIYNED